MSHARYMPHTIMSPWAKFTTRMTPKISVSPTAIRLNTPPNSTPLSSPCATSVASIASGLGAREHELLQGSVLGPHGHRPLPEDLDHRRDCVRIVAGLVEMDRTAVLHQARAVVGLLDCLDDRVGIVELGRPLEHVGDDEDGVVRIAGVRVEEPATGALLIVLGQTLRLGAAEVRPGVAGHHVLEILFERGDLARLVQSRTAGADDAERLDALLA